MKKLLVFLYLLSAVSCKDQKIFEIPFQKSQLVLNAVLRANEPPQVFVGRTWPATGVFPEKVYIDNATVKLFEDGLYVGDLIHANNGIYKLTTYKLKAEKKYFVKVTANGFESVENLPVRMPSLFPLQSIIIDKTTPIGSLNQSAKPVLLKVRFRGGVLSELQYGVVVDTYSNNFVVAGNLISPLETSISLTNPSNENCIKRSALLGDFDFKPLLYKSPLIVYNSNCFLDSEKGMNLVIETVGYVQKINDYSQQTADEIRLQLVSLSPEYYEYAQKNKFFEGLDYAFNEPTPTFTNVKGGYGVVVAINSTYKVLKL